MKRRRPNFAIVFVTAAITVASLAAFVGHRHHHFRHHHGCQADKTESCQSDETKTDNSSKTETTKPVE